MVPLRGSNAPATNPPACSSAPTHPTAEPTFAIAANVDATSSASEYARYIHQCICSPPSATLLGALTRSKELITIPGLTPALIRNHLPQSTATDKGHMRRHRSNTASTRNNQKDVVAARTEVDHMFPQHELCTMQEPHKVRIHDLCPMPTGKPTTMPANTKQQTYSHPIVEPDDDRDEMPTTRSSTNHDAPPDSSLIEPRAIFHAKPCTTS